MLSDLAKLLAIAESQNNFKAALIISETMTWILETRREQYHEDL